LKEEEEKRENEDEEKKEEEKKKKTTEKMKRRKKRTISTASWVCGTVLVKRCLVLLYLCINLFSLQDPEQAMTSV
jgi:cell division septal protein FtsQ